MRPLVRLLMQSGMTFPVFSDVIRPLFVDVAVRDLLTDADSRTDSRVSLLTGVHRKEVRRLREAGAGEVPQAPPALSLASALIARWIGTPAYLDEAGHPRRLPRSTAAGEAQSFEALVASVTSDVRPRAVLDQLVAQEIVTIEADDHVRLNVAAFLPQQGREEQIFYFGRNLHDHIAAASANVGRGGAARFFDRSVHYDGLTEAQAARLEETGRELGQALLVELNRLALAMLDEAGAETPPGPPSAAMRRVNLGVYLYAEDEADRRDG